MAHDTSRCEPVHQFHTAPRAGWRVPKVSLYNGPSRFFYPSAVFRHVLDAKRETETTQPPVAGVRLRRLPGLGYDPHRAGECARLHHRPPPGHEGLHRQPDHQGQGADLSGGAGLHGGARRLAAVPAGGGTPLRPGAGCAGVVSPLGLFPAEGLLGRLAQVAPGH